MMEIDFDVKNLQEILKKTLQDFGNRIDKRAVGAIFDVKINWANGETFYHYEYPLGLTYKKSDKKRKPILIPSAEAQRGK